MPLITKPDYEFIWASGGAIVEPSDVKKQLGWTPEVPPHQWENWIQNRQDQYIAHVNQRGIPEWDGNTEYEASGLSYVQGSNGTVYKSVAASGPSTTTQDPTTDVTDTYWTVAFADVGAFLTQADGDTRYTQRTNNLSDLNSISTARTNLSVYSKTETDTRNLNSVRIDVAAAASIDLIASAPNTRHINITGSGTSISSFNITAGQTYFTVFAGASRLVNGASLVTQRGIDIDTAAGDTCIFRATADDVVEVLCYTRFIPDVLGTAQAAAGTSIDFTSIPAWVNSITLIGSGVSTNGTSVLQFQLGVAGVPVTTGYTGSVSGGNTGVASNLMTAGFRADTARTAVDISHFIVELRKISGNTWVCAGQLNNSDAGAFRVFTGTIALAGTLNMVRATMANGTDSFDAGTFNITYRG